MSSLIISGDTTGSCTLLAPLVAGSSVLTLPVATDTLVGKATTDVLTNKTLTSPVINGMGSSILTSGTALPSTSGASIKFTGIPSWAKRITLIFDGVSVTSTIPPLIRLGVGTVLESTGGYSGSTWYHSGGGISATAVSVTGFDIINTIAASNKYSGTFTITKISTGNTWIINGYVGGHTVSGGGVGGTKTLAGLLDSVGVELPSTTFNAGTINIMYE